MLIHRLHGLRGRFGHSQRPCNGGAARAANLEQFALAAGADCRELQELAHTRQEVAFGLDPLEGVPHLLIELSPVTQPHRPLGGVLVRAAEHLEDP